MFLLVASAVFAQAGKRPAKAAVRIQTWRQLHALTTEQAQLRYPVHLHVVVTYAPTLNHYLWAQDRTGGGFAYLPEGDPIHFALGEALDLEGVTDPGKFGPCLRVVSYRDLGAAKLPKPQVVPLQRLLAGSETGRRIQIEGRLVAVAMPRTPAAKTRMVLATEGARITVLLEGMPLQDAGELLDSEVRLTATSSITFNAQRQFTGIALNLARPQDIVVLIPGSRDLPVSKIDQLLRYRPGIGINDTRAKVAGVVTYYNSRKVAVIQDGDRAVYVQLAEAARLTVGNRAYVLGYPRARASSPILMDGRAYQLPQKAQVEPRPITASDALTGQLDSILVRIDGELVDHSYSREQQVMTLRSGDTSFVAEFPENASDQVSQLQDGSRLQLTGVLHIQMGGPNNASQSFHVLLRKRSDVVILKHPSWLSRTRLFYIALGLIALVVCVLIWVMVLRRQVLRQTRRLLEQRRREVQHEKSHQVLVENASDLIFTLSKDGHFLSANPATMRVTGWPMSELTTASLKELLLTEQRATFESWLSDLLLKGESSGEFDIRTVSGSARTLDLSAHVSTLNADQMHLDFVGRDVTERKRTHAELERARWAAESASAAKTRFLANMSHEIRTPLNAVLGMADLLAATHLTPDQRRYVETFQNSGDTLLALLNGILDLNRVESGQLQLECIPFQTVTLVSELVEMMAAKARKKGIKLEWNVGSDVPPYLAGDPGRLRQILTNLLGNAVKFTERGEVRIEVALHSWAVMPSSKVTFRFSVRDTGIGIAADQLGFIFERFTQADNSTTRKFGGSGLGLSISRGLAEAMGGTIEVSSTPGKGSEFRLMLPLEVPPPIEAGTRPGQFEIQEAPDETCGQTSTILVAEDNEANRMVIEAYLRGPAFALDYARNGLEAVAMEAQNQYDLVLMDIEMPEMDGHEAARRICERRRNAGLPPVAILALTAHAFEEERGPTQLAGCSELLTKPIQRKILLAAIARHLPQPQPDVAPIS